MQPKFKIENSALSQAMWCNEQSDGNIACEMTFGDVPDFTFSVEELSKVKYEDPNYMGHEFDESYIYEFPENKQIVDDFGPFAGVIEMATSDYDKFNFAVKMFQKGESIERLSKFVPELRGKSLDGVAALSDDFDSFNIKAFYDFCRTNPATK
jgi:hypothetical protein